MKVNFLSVGRIKESYYLDALAEYDKRLGRYGEVKRSFVEEEKEGKDKLPKEGSKLLPKLQGYVIVADINGDMLSSEQLADRVKQAQAQGTITVVVGGSTGLDQEIKQHADLRWSLSRATLPHSLANVAVTEQIYRAFTIIAGAKYHK